MVSPEHPAARWLADLNPLALPRRQAIRLAGAAGHLQLDRIAARRALVLELLLDGRPLTRGSLTTAVEAVLGPCWGTRPDEALLRDLNALRLGGVRIAYSRRRGSQGYYLQDPPLEKSVSKWHEPVNWLYVASIDALTPAQKLRRAFGSAGFALRQRRLLLREAHPEWAEAEIERQARRVVYRGQAASDV